MCVCPSSWGWRGWRGSSPLTGSGVLFTRLPAPFHPQALPSPQYAAGDLRWVEDDHVGEFQSPRVWRRISRFLLYILQECDEQLFSHHGGEWTQCSRTDPGQTVRRTAWLCGLCQGRLSQPQTHWAVEWPSVLTHPFSPQVREQPC